MWQDAREGWSEGARERGRDEWMEKEGGKGVRDGEEDR